MENSNTGRIPTPKKKQDINHHTTKPKGENHIHIMPPTTTNTTGANNHLSLVSLNIDGLNSPIKRHKLTDWRCKQNPAFCCIQETHSMIKTDATSELKAGKKSSKQMVPRYKQELPS